VQIIYFSHHSSVRQWLYSSPTCRPLLAAARGGPQWERGLLWAKDNHPSTDYAAEYVALAINAALNADSVHAQYTEILDQVGFLR
jgi:hypothetical protein